MPLQPADSPGNMMGNLLWFFFLAASAFSHNDHISPAMGSPGNKMGSPA